MQMLSRRTVLSNVLMNVLLAAGVLGSATAAWSKPVDALRSLDPDHDGTVDLDEAKKAAGALFDRLDRDHDGTLDRRELAGRLGAKDLAAADPDKDGTLTKDEYLAVVEQRFRAADPDHDGTLDAKELRTRQGRALLRLLT
jgi:Ca2+-binding EF-hand superfamily protein